MSNKPAILLSTNRDNYTDNVFFGSVYLANSKRVYKRLGADSSEIFFMRSLAKPLQASILADYNIISDYKLNEKELALFCASHAGSSEHVSELKKTIKRFNIKLSDLELCAQLPLDNRNFKGRITKLHNNCSGKHIMMILMSKYLGFDIKNYTKENHPIQKIIHQKQNKLSGFKSDILTFDGCSTPLWGLSADGIINAYFNFFNDKKYKIIVNSILKNPYLFGGFDRFDTEIIKKSKKQLFAKVGAGGFILVYNFNRNEILLVKLTQNNNKERKLITLDILNKLNWLKTDIEEWEYNQKNQKVAKYCYEFQI